MIVVSVVIEINLLWIAYILSSQKRLVCLYRKIGTALALESYKTTVHVKLIGTSLSEPLSYQSCGENSVCMCLCTKYVSMYESVYVVICHPGVHHTCPLDKHTMLARVVPQNCLRKFATNT